MPVPVPGHRAAPLRRPAAPGATPVAAVPAGAAPARAEPVADEDAEALAAERDLVRRARAGDAAAFERLVEPLMRPAFQLATRLIGDRQLAEDAAQDALVKAFLAMRNFRGDSRFGTWIFRIVHNACTDVLRHRARHPQVPLGGARREYLDDDLPPREPADPAAGPEDVVVELEGRRAILAAVDALPAEYRSVVILRDVHGLSYEEVAAITGQNLGTVKSRLHRGRSALRAALAPRGSSPGAARDGQLGDSG